MPKEPTKPTPVKKPKSWPEVREHFAKYGADKDSIAWLQVAEKNKSKMPTDVGHASGKPGKDNFDQHVLKALKAYIADLKEELSLSDTDPKADRLTYWKEKHDIN